MSTQTVTAIIREKELAQMLGVTTKTIRTWIAIGTLPAPMRLGPKVVAWRRSTIDAWLEKQERQAK